MVQKIDVDGFSLRTDKNGQLSPLLWTDINEEAIPKMVCGWISRQRCVPLSVIIV